MQPGLVSRAKSRAVTLQGWEVAAQLRGQFGSWKQSRNREVRGEPGPVGLGCLRGGDDEVKSGG